MELKDTRVLVFGTGISGIAAAKLLEEAGADTILYDGNVDLDAGEIKSRLSLKSKTEILLGELPDEMIASIELVVISPGVPLDIPAVQRIRKENIPIWGEVELAYRMERGTVLAITGTNGKTTTTALLGRIIQDYANGLNDVLLRPPVCEADSSKGKKSVFVVGNIGTPYTKSASLTDENSYTVAEISSFQLETIETFAPRVSAILNITEDHLNRHHTMEEYIRVKELIVSNQKKDDVCVLNYEDEVLRSFGEQIVPRVIYFSSQRKLDSGVYLDGDAIILSTKSQVIPVVKTGKLKLLGQHNYENVMAAIAMAYSIGVPMDIIRASVTAFEAVEHRIEFVTEKDGVAYYNDSKGTNPDAAIKGICAMDRPTLLIAGGYDKESVYDEWIASFEGKVRLLVLIGQTREKIEQAAHKKGVYQTILADSLEDAVQICAKRANPGDAVLLSPACASWGQFENYEQRGNMFKEYVHKL